MSSENARSSRFSAATTRSASSRSRGSFIAAGRQRRDDDVVENDLLLAVQYLTHGEHVPNGFSLKPAHRIMKASYGGGYARTEGVFFAYRRCQLGVGRAHFRFQRNACDIEFSLQRV